MMGIRLTACAITIATCAALSGCAIAPGMRVDASDKNPSADASPSVIEITPEFVRRAGGASATLTAPDDALALIAAPQPYRIGPADVLSAIVWDQPALGVANHTYDSGATGGALPASVGLTSQTVPGFVVGH